APPVLARLRRPPPSSLSPYTTLFRSLMRTAPDPRIVRGPGCVMRPNCEKMPNGGRAGIPEYQCKIFERKAKIPLGHVETAPQIDRAVDGIVVRLSFPFRNFEKVIELHVSSFILRGAPDSHRRPS